MTNETPEEWRPVVGYEGLYEVSDLGRVKALARKRLHYSGVDSVFPERIKKTTPNTSGHHMTQLTKDGLKQGKLVHRLVLEAFAGLPQGTANLGLHWDDNTDNNHLTNLRWGTAQDNQRDALRNGRNTNALKTVCSNGHDYTDQNTYREPVSGKRQCHACRSFRNLKQNRNKSKERSND